jgi:hypothetical protein
VSIYYIRRRDDVRGGDDHPYDAFHRILHHPYDGLHDDGDRGGDDVYSKSVDRKMKVLLLRLLR